MFFLKTNMELELEPSTLQVYPYCSDCSLPFAGVIHPQVHAPHGPRRTTTLAVCEARNATTLLGRQTATELGLLHIGPLNAVAHIRNQEASTRSSSNTVGALPARKVQKRRVADPSARTRPPSGTLTDEGPRSCARRPSASCRHSPLASSNRQQGQHLGSPAWWWHPINPR